MGQYSKHCLQMFLKKQGQLYDEPMAENIEEAEEFLEDSLAVVVKNAGEVKEYMEAAGVDMSGMSKEEILDQAEVFDLEDGSYLILEV